MNKELWRKISRYNFDNPPSEYGFSIRLAKENFWTIDFTAQAILEYKKFMFLAATSEFMVSPSEIIDNVWHQHLIFSQSYNDFCNLIGKHIQHLPSTHNKEEFEKFRQAKERTKSFYERDFGSQPKNIWAYNNMFESLNLEKAKFKLRTFIIFGIFTFICLTVPAYYLLQSLYLKIENPYFVVGFVTLSLITLLNLEFYNKSQLKSIVATFDKTSFIYNLHPFELVYLKTQNLSNVINGTVNQLVDIGSIKINKDNTIDLVKVDVQLGSAQVQVNSVLEELGTTYYPNLLKKVATKPIFWNISNSMDAFRKYFNKSKKFGSLFYANFSILTLLVLVGFARITAGILRDKPVAQVVIATILLVVMTTVFLHRLTKLISTHIIPDIYINNILPTMQIKNNWQWTYFLLGTAALTTSFIPLANYINKKITMVQTVGPLVVAIVEVLAAVVEVAGETKIEKIEVNDFHHSIRSEVFPIK